MNYLKVFSAPMKGSSWMYCPLDGNPDHHDHSDKLEDTVKRRATHTIKRRRDNLYDVLTTTACIGLLGLMLVLSWDRWKRYEPQIACRDPPQRREWRTLRPQEQQSYIDAVLCLSDRPSIFEPGSSRFDDMAYLHLNEGTITHYAAAFLPFHRYFIHIFEKALGKECGYYGGLPYWDWSLDSSDLALSPIWRDIGGFGGSGNPDIGEEISGGHCITSGPFAYATRHWKAKWNGNNFEPVAKPHCLSRGFVAPGADKDDFQKGIAPESLADVLAHPEYDGFLKILEMMSHNSIPQFVQGDFFLGTAPNDPVFYLHHAQVDRLWWLWQQEDAEHRLYAFQGAAENQLFGGSNSSEKASVAASLNDVLTFGRFGDHVQIRDLMRTDTSLLCYKY
ncbi:Di-copper centre-containing protein [Nemania sp. FL0916]|nr:Di-copper centre-containing protein [Nemania sp. FL0916]